MLTSDPFQIISLIGFPKPQIFIFSPVLKARCDNTAAVLRYRRPRKQTQRRVRLLRFSKDAQKEMKRRPSGRSYVSSTRIVVGRWCDWGHQIPKQCFFFHWKRTMWLVQREVTALIHFNRRSQVTTRNKRSQIKLKRRPLPSTTISMTSTHRGNFLMANPPHMATVLQQRRPTSGLPWRRPSKLIPFSVESEAGGRWGISLRRADGNRPSSATFKIRL